MRCWICGEEPDWINVQTLSDPGPVLIPGAWPQASDGHRHAERPPTPAELEQAGHEALRRILEG
ncbi:hypothetical protein GCM10010168_86030 [Actinoplanes ianthinogenes]|uniref:NUDIX hydrolase n=1 Tax=Actinoplanes ianthinogenes TaxID=122358 RepID=A0ABN6CK15_9ACTN|nr:hypothetical protein [Actinoplanes ianthinogenes]BCJ45334.1 hypothetical protein Aiant_59910 [Actinoplanes ianthinogenes]GGR53843.1 hypothetical protein GCM10010168_86030 [Actinoplanes ianthinogenes]